ncbi:MAG TPA: hypothetical protein VE781_03945, partial [Kineosporiaceae bacterium]|nr:hypothetical protein [Kineosporiaceae bacterium]
MGRRAIRPGGSYGSPSPRGGPRHGTQLSGPLGRRLVAAALAVPVALGAGVALAGAQRAHGPRPAAGADQTVLTAAGSTATRQRTAAPKRTKKASKPRKGRGRIAPGTGLPADLVVDAAAPGNPVPAGVLGGNMVGSENVTLPGFGSSMRGLGMRMLRWPGGSLSDGYHWKTNTVCPGMGFMNAGSTFDNFLRFRRDMGSPAPDVNITVNYGSNASCNGPGDPAEAAAWVDHANNVEHAGIRYWSIGNEQMWGNHDLHSPKNDAHTYAAAVKEYSRQMKAKDPSIKVGVVVAGKYQTGWDDTVLREAKGAYDFVEIHWYAPHLSDAALVGHAAGQGLGFWAEDLAVLRTEMKAAGVDLPVYLGEWGPSPERENKTTTSIYGGLFTAQMLGDLLQQGVDQATYFMGIGFCGDAPDTAGVHGPLVLGSYGLQSDGLDGCTAAGKVIPVGTP